MTLGQYPHCLQHIFPLLAKCWGDKHPKECQWLYKWRVMMQFNWLYKERKPLKKRGWKKWKEILHVENYLVIQTWILYELMFLDLSWESVNQRTCYPLVPYAIFSIYYLLKPYKQIKVDFRSPLSNKFIALGHIT